MAGAARAVRIRREVDATSVPTTTPTAAGAAGPPVTSSRRMVNSAGTARAYRTFVVFLVAFAIVYGVFLSIAATSVSNGTNYPVEVFLTVATAVGLVVGWWVTLGQAPISAGVENGELVVRPRIGRPKRFGTGTLRLHVLRTNGAGWFGPEATEFVEVSTLRGVRRTYLVGTHFFDFAQ